MIRDASAAMPPAPPPQPARARRPTTRLAERIDVDVDPALRPAVGDEQLRMVLSHTRLGTLVATAFALFFALQLRGTALPAWTVDLWLTAKLVVAGARIVLSLRYDRLGRPGGAAWRNTTDAWLLADGVIWGIGGLLVYPSEVPLAALVSSVMACVSCVATFGLQVSQRSTAAYVGPILACTATALLLRGDQLGTIGGTGLLGLLALLVTTAAASERRLIESVLLRLRALALTAEKDEALKLALRQSAVKTQFLGNISHELRTPLHGILGVARLLHLEAQDSAVARRVELIESSGTHLLGLINDLLDVSRIESGRFALRSERFELGALADTLGGVYAVRASDKGLDFHLDLQFERPCWVQGDASRVRQVLHNLLGNAVKFTKQGSITLTLQRDAGSGQLRAEVLDTGPGIAASDLATVFEAFGQVAGADAKPTEGTGLGLTIARDIARAMGGDLVLRSTVGTGTSALFTAPLPNALPAQTEPTQLPLAEPQAGASIGGARVLIAEDDDVNAVIATAYLEQLGVQVERVRDGRQAVRHALREVNRPDIVLMDCRMPLLDGMAATREIRRQERTLGLSRLPVVALTASSCEVSRAMCLDAGMDDFLSKPYTQKELTQLLDRWMRREQPLAA